MTLPSSRRPPYAEQLLAEEYARSLNPVKVKINKYEVFVESMISWYMTEADKKTKKKLSEKKLKAKARLVAKEVNTEYSALPYDWIPKFMERTGHQFRERKRDRKAREAAEAEEIMYALEEARAEEESN